MKKTLHQLNQLTLLQPDPVIFPANTYESKPLPERCSSMLFVPCDLNTDAGTYKNTRAITQTDLYMMRRRLAGVIPCLAQKQDRQLEVFLQTALRSSFLLEAYFHPKLLKSLQVSSRAPVTLVPATLAIRAASKAASFEMVCVEERRLTYIATLLHSCGLFYFAKHQKINGQSVPTVSTNYFRMVRMFMLSVPIQNLRMAQPPMADTLAAVLGLAQGGSGNAGQAARISAAVSLANLELASIWTPPA